MIKETSTTISSEPQTTSPGFERFMEALKSAPTDTSKILNCHLLAEYYLEQIIHARLPRGDILLDANFTFANKLTVVEALQVVTHATTSSIRALNKVRNACSHQLDYKVTESAIDAIGQPFAEVYVKAKKETAKDMLLVSTLSFPLASLEAAYDLTIKRIIENGNPKVS